VRGSQIEIKAKAGSSVAKVARGILHNLDGYLAATQLGITIASLGLGVVGEGVVTNIVLSAFSKIGYHVIARVYHCQPCGGIFNHNHIAYCVWRAWRQNRLAIQKSVRTTISGIVAASRFSLSYSGHLFGCLTASPTLY
jgi:hypothetical protein